MSDAIKVMAVLIPQPGTDRTIVRARWYLPLADTGSSQIVFPLPEDTFKVDLLIAGNVADSTVVAPHPWMMLDPPRTMRNLKNPVGNPDAQDWWNALPAAWPWTCLDPALEDLQTGPTSTAALGVVHLLRGSHPAFVERRLRDLAENWLQQPGKLPQAVHPVSAAELKGWPELFAALYRRFPGHPDDVLPTIRAALRTVSDQASISAMLPWLEPQLSVLAGNAARTMAALLHMLAMLDQKARAIAGPADAARALMALRANQGGELLDYWCDYDLGAAATPSATCPPGSQGRRVFAAEAFGLGVDFVVDAAAVRDEIKVVVTQQRLAATMADPRYAFPNDDTLAPCQDGNFTIRKGWLHGAAARRAESHPPPPAARFAAWVDYDTVSSYALAAGDTLEQRLPDVMSLARPATGDGVVSIRIDLPIEPGGFSYDYAFNVYCIWDGEVSGKVQRYFDRPGDAAALADLKPFLLTRRYSYRRDLVDAFNDPHRISELNLHEHPPHDAQCGQPDSITQNGTAVPYPARHPDRLSASLTFNLRDQMPEANAPQGVHWERQGGGRPDLYDKEIWTVEGQRPGSITLGAAELPQRYRIFITAVDAFEQESDPVPVMASEPGEPDDADGDRVFFVPRWRSPPPAAEHIVCGRHGAPGMDRLDIHWRVGAQSMIGTALATFRRLPLRGEVAVMRRPIREVLPSRTAPLEASMAQRALNPLLAREIDELARSGWEVWQLTETPIVSNPLPPTLSFPLGQGDKGYEYIVCVNHVIPDERRAFIQRAQLQTLRYLKEGGAGFEEAIWPIPSSPAAEQWRSTPAFGAVGRSRPVVVLPDEQDDIAFSLAEFRSTLVRATAVMNVAGINRDLVLAKIIALSDPAPQQVLADEPQPTLSTAHRFMIETALARIPLGNVPAQHQMLRDALGRSFLAYQGAPRSEAHPIIGLRGAVRMQWQAQRATDAVPVVQYRAYQARIALPLASTPYRATHADHLLDFGTGPKPKLTGNRPVLVLLSADNHTWAALAAASGSVIRIYDVRLCQFAADDGLVLPAGPFDVHIAHGEEAARIPASMATSPQEHTIVVPVPGGYRELAAWWLAAADCTGKERWLDDAATPRLITAALPATVMPLPIRSLTARPAIRFPGDAPDAIGDLAPFLPAGLPEAGLALLPRAILNWELAEISQHPGDGEYLFFEREEDRALQAQTLAVDPAWGLLRAIQAGPTGAPWDESYRALQSWLEGKSSPSPGQEAVPALPAFFFAPDDAAAWKLGNLWMLGGKPSPAHGAFVDYFDSPPSAGGTQPMLGETRLRYRAYKLLDLHPEQGPPTNADLSTRFLVSEPSPWTAWVLPEWPRFAMTHKSALKIRGEAPLVRFGVRSAWSRHLTPSPVSPFFFRLTFRRDVAEAFSPSEADSVLVGNLLEVPLAGGSVPIEMSDMVLERDAYLAECTAHYRIAWSLVWRHGTGPDDERVLRMFDAPYPLRAVVPGTLGNGEAMAEIMLTIALATDPLPR